MSPQAYQGLYFDDYPTKNENQVIELACQKVFSAATKQQISDRVNELVKPEIESRTSDMNSIVRTAACKAVEKAIEIAVKQAVDGIASKIKTK